MKLLKRQLKSQKKSQIYYGILMYYFHYLNLLRNLIKKA